MCSYVIAPGTTITYYPNWWYTTHPGTAVLPQPAGTVPQGWQCPKCQRIYSPSTEECRKCNADAG